MNLDRLKQAEAEFLIKYPLGFSDPAMADIVKRHNKAKLDEFAQESFTLDCASHVEQTVANMVRCVSRSSMVSMFEKPKFRDFCARLDRAQKAFLVDSLVAFLHGEQQAGFEGMLELLLTEKLGRWSLMTIIPSYFAPQQEVFVKPTTAKSIIKGLQLTSMQYKPRPSWEFYSAYRQFVNTTKVQVDECVAPSNVAFTGFLMMALAD